MFSGTAAAAVVVDDRSCCKESCSATSSTRPSMNVCLGHPMRIVVGYLWCEMMYWRSSDGVEGERTMG